MELNYFMDFESFREKYKLDETLLDGEYISENSKMGYLIQYAILYKAWEVIFQLLEKCLSKYSCNGQIVGEKNYMTLNQIIKQGAKGFFREDGEEEFTAVACKNLTIRDLLIWNKEYLVYADEKKHKKRYKFLIERLTTEYSENCPLKEMEYYTDISTMELVAMEGAAFGCSEEKDTNLLNLFFKGIYPMQSAKKIPNQQVAAAHLQEVPFNMIFDEVGAGKTVSSLYCLRNVLLEKGEEAKILIVCPNGKISDWKKDIKRQLGLYSKCLDNSDKDNWIYLVNKEQFFKEQDPAIFIKSSSKTDSNKTDNLEYWIDEELWDLVIIDEGHERSATNYNKIRAQKALLLTATPIGITSVGDGMTLKKNIEYYVSILSAITGHICGWEKNNLFGVSNYFTQFFREDMGVEATDREIKFISVKRNEYREQILGYLERTGQIMVRLSVDQDDEYMLSHKSVKSVFPDIKIDGVSEKRKELLKYIKQQGNSEKSYIIFCEHTEVVDGLYQLIRTECKNAVVAYMHGTSRGITDEDSKMKGRSSDQTQEEFIEKVLGAILEGKRVIFVTTGKKSGTGWNLGLFHGVINYELPYTCIELEQRFGRVDRLDEAISAEAQEEKEMIFFLNENDDNRMLHYSATKIDITCRRMPVRNTVLFQPPVVKSILAGFYKRYEERKKQFHENREMLKGYCELFKEYPEGMKVLEAILNYKGNNNDSQEREERISASIDIIKPCLTAWQERYSGFNTFSILDAFKHLEKNAYIPWAALVLDKKYIETGLNSWKKMLNPKDSEDFWRDVTENKDQEETNSDTYRKIESVDSDKDAETEMEMHNPDLSAGKEAVSGNQKFEEVERFYSLDLEKIEFNPEKQKSTGLYFIINNVYYRFEVEKYRKILNETTGE